MLRSSDRFKAMYDDIRTAYPRYNPQKVIDLSEAIGQATISARRNVAKRFMKNDGRKVPFIFQPIAAGLRVQNSIVISGRIIDRLLTMMMKFPRDFTSEENEALHKVVCQFARKYCVIDLVRQRQPKFVGKTMTAMRIWLLRRTHAVKRATEKWQRAHRIKSSLDETVLAMGSPTAKSWKTASDTVRTVLAN